MEFYRFEKMQGTGNDFVLLPQTYQPEDLNVDQIRFLCDRHFGVGADGVLFVCPSEKGDFMMRMFNPDGSEAEMCGNGIRCFAKHLRDTGLSEKDEIPIESKAGLHLCRVYLGEDGLVSDVEVGMGVPRFERNELGVKGEGRLVGEALENDSERVVGTGVSMGNPHFVVFEAKDIPEAKRVGPLFETHPLFTARTNVEFVEQLGDQHLKVVVWERGAGITMACGTGACATVAAATLEKRVDASKPVRVDLPGGTLTIRTDQETGEIWMLGPAAFVFAGEIAL